MVATELLWLDLLPRWGARQCCVHACAGMEVRSCVSMCAHVCG